LVLGRGLDETFGDEVRSNVTLVTVGRLTANAGYRYSGPFLGAIARGMHVTLDQIGVAIAVAELSGLTGPWIGKFVDRIGSRRAMWIGLAGVGAGAVAAASAPNLIVFAVGLFVLGASKSSYDIGLGSWIADRVAYERRSRVVGLTETSWALGLLVGVSVMGVATGLANFRLAYVIAAVAVVAMAALIRLRLPADVTVDVDAQHPKGRMNAAGTFAVLGMSLMAAASQCLFVSFGSWLQDSHGFTATALAGVTFTLGAFELGASLVSAHRTDRWGKERSALIGTALMIPGALLLIVAHGSVVVGLIGVFLAIIVFEFAIVSSIAIGSQLVPGSAATGLAWVVGGCALGRSVAAIPATALYRRDGVIGPAWLTVGLAVAATLCFATRARLRSLQPATPRLAAGSRAGTN